MNRTRLKVLTVATVAVLAIGGGTMAFAGSDDPEPTTVEEQLAQVEAQVDELGQQYAALPEGEEEGSDVFIEIGRLQDQRMQLCDQLAEDSPARDLYC